MLAGTVTLVLLLDSDTVAPPLGAAALRVTAQLDEPGAVTVAGLQESPLRVTAACWNVTVPPVLDTGIADPLTPTATGLATPTLAEPLAPEAAVIFTSATSPSLTTAS